MHFDIPTTILVLLCFLKTSSEPPPGPLAVELRHLSGAMSPCQCSQLHVTLSVFPASCLLALFFYLISFWPGLALDCFLAGLLGKEMNTLPFPAIFWFTCEFSVFNGCMEGLYFSSPRIGVSWRGWGRGCCLQWPGSSPVSLEPRWVKSLGKGEPENPGRVEFQEWQVRTSSSTVCLPGLAWPRDFC